MADNEIKQIEVEVAYATAQRQTIIPLTVEEGTTVKQAAERSGIMARFPQINLETDKMGIFGKAAKATALLREGDRIEIYRPLIADPKEARKKRAAQGKKLTNRAKANKTAK